MVRAAMLQSDAVTLPEALDLGLRHHQSGRLAEAEAIYRQILAVEPRHADALHLLGLIAQQVGRHDLAVEMILQAIALLPTAAVFHSNLGEAYRKLGRIDQATASYRRAIELNPNLPDAHNNLGLLAAEAGRCGDAAVAYRRAIELRPDFVEAHYNLGKVLKEQGLLGEAVAACRRALQLKPDYADAYNNLGVALQEQGQLDEALDVCQRAAQFAPDSAAVHYNLGNVLRDQGRLDEAGTAFRRALQLEPEFAKAHNNLGNVLEEQCLIDEAIAGYRRALQLKPDEARVRCPLLFDLHYLPGFDAEEMFREHCRWEELHAGPLAEFLVPHRHGRDPERRLRIGYVSPDFREHPVAFFLEGLLAAHDRAQVEVFCYADLTREDAVSMRLRQLAGHWRKITGRKDEQVAEMIRQDGIDILVDLAGHTAKNRLLVFARKPAPVQVSWLGYPDTTGMKAMDYRLTDASADPPGSTEQWHSEQLVRLPESAWCYQPAGDAPPVSAAPCEQTGFVTFGSFNAQQKINGPLLALWAEILRRVPGSRLLLKNRSLGNASVQARMRVLLEESGIAPERVEMVGPIAGSAGHLTAYGRVDIALDTFPYHGTTTTCEAMWMGVPVVTLAGQTHVSRVGVSLLSNVGLPEMIAGSAEEYVEIAVKLAADVVRLAELRSTLRERMQASPLMDAPRFARNIEQAYRQMWRAWCARQCSSPTP